MLGLPVGGRAPLWPAGDSPVATPRGCRPRSLICAPEYRAGDDSRNTEMRPAGRTARATMGAWSHRPVPSTIPDSPGSYQFNDAEGRVIYVGKAKSLRSRLSNYFVHRRCCRAHLPDGAARPTRSSGSTVRNEVEALFLEFNLIKRHRPRFNIRLKDDKSYPYLAVTLDEEWPRAMVMRGPEAQGRPLLRPVRARLRDPRDARPPAAHVPDPHVHQDQVRPPPPARPAVPLRAHREVRGAVRRRHRRTTST